MRLPPWAVEAIRNGVADVARKASDAETIAKVKEQATELLRDLPENTSRGIDAIVKTATEKARDALDQGRESLQRWASRDSDLAIRCINGSGTLLNETGTGVTLSDQTLQLACDILRGDCLSQSLSDRLHQTASKELRLDQCSIAVANSLDGAIASLASLAGDRSMVIHRSQAIRLPSGTPLPETLGAVNLHECGGVQAISPGDFDSVDHACVLFADGGHAEIKPVDFGDRDVLKVAILSTATIKSQFESIPSAVSTCAAGFDLVIVAGGALSGTADCGIIIGKKDLVERVETASVWNNLKAAAAVQVTVLAALSNDVPSSVGVLIDTNEENLRARAERMAIRLTADESITSCLISDNPAKLIESGRRQFPSRQLKLRHQKWSADQWCDQLLAKDPALVTQVDGEDLVVDFRWFKASEDAAVAEALGSTASDQPQSR